jgi:hypothetical protein
VLTQTALLRRLEEEGYPTSWYQLRLFRDAGIVPEPEGARYPEEAVERVKTAHRLAREGVRSLARRTLRMYVFGYQFSPELVLKALRWVAGKMKRKQPRRKLKTIAGALDEIAEHSRKQTQHVWPVGQQGDKRKRWSDIARTLDVRRWQRLLDRATPRELTDGEFGLLRYALTQVRVFPSWGATLEKIPAEEQLLLLFVLWLERKARTEKAARKEALS